MLNSNVQIGTRISAWRKAKGISRRQLAEKADVSYMAVYYWERDDDRATTPKGQHLEKVVDALGITMSRFYGPIPKQRKQAA